MELLLDSDAGENSNPSPLSTSLGFLQAGFSASTSSLSSLFRRMSFSNNRGQFTRSNTEDGRTNADMALDTALQVDEDESSSPRNSPNLMRPGKARLLSVERTNSNTTAAGDEPELALGHDTLPQPEPMPSHHLSGTKVQIQNSPLHRAGLLQTRSYSSSPYTPTLNPYQSPSPNLSPSHQTNHAVVPHSQKSIRLNTMQLSNMFLSPPPPFPSSQYGSYGSLPKHHHFNQPSSNLTPIREREHDPQHERGRERDSFIFPHVYTLSSFDSEDIPSSSLHSSPGSFPRLPSLPSRPSIDRSTTDLSLSTGSLSDASIDTSKSTRFPSTLTSSFSSADSGGATTNQVEGEGEGEREVDSDNETEIPGIATPRQSSPPPRRDQHQHTTHPSGLSILLSQQQSRLRAQRFNEGGTTSPTTPNTNAAESISSATVTAHASPTIATNTITTPTITFTRPSDNLTPDERAPLLLHPPSTDHIPISIPSYASTQPRSHSHSHYATISSSTSPTKPIPGFLSKCKHGGGTTFRLVVNTLKEVRNKDNWKSGVKALPAVLLGSLLNILDGVSYGMIIFPATSVFAEHQAGPMGVSMFFVSCVIAQLTYTLGGSGFSGANGSMMIEVVPFFHILATSIADQIGEDYPREIIATTLVAYALSSILTGLAFFLLGALRLGVIIGFFPRHILVGCIGGVGVFLILTGLTVSTRLPDDDFAFDLETFKFFVLNTHNLVLWLVPLGLAILLRVITHRYTHQLVFPMYFIVIPLLFYIVVAAARLDLGMLRHEGWLFDVGTEQVAWYKFYAYLDFSAVRFAPLWNTLPTQFALLFFNVLHPPLNVPALSVSLNEDIDTNKELVGHGYSNLLAGLVGTVPNYLVYVNTLLFYRVGGHTRVAAFLLAVATAALLFIGTGPIAYIPVMVVGALIFVLGLDLVKEALWDARHRASRNEYITIISIMVCMTVWDFVIGVLFGIIMSCFFFVVQNSQVPSIRALHSGETAMSSVRRPSSQRDYLREVSRQTTIMNLQGFLFFGTIVSVEECIRDLVEGPSWQRSPVRFLVLDLSLVAGIDMSAAEAFVRVHRLVIAKHVILVFCGFDADSAIGRALQTVEVLGADGVELFSALNDALEWTENAYLRAWFRSHKAEISAYAFPGRRDADILFAQSFGDSPRLSHLHDVGNRTIAQDFQPHFDISANEHREPFNTLVKAFSSYGEISFSEFRPILTYLERISIPESHILWNQNDPPDGLYIIESGVLRATYHFADDMYTPTLEESMVAGTLAGELSALSDSPRNARVVAERPSVLWKLSMEELGRFEREDPVLFWRFCQLVLKAAKIDYDILLSSLATRR